MNGELMLSLKWMGDAGYLVDHEHRSIIRVPNKTKHKTYLEHIAEKNGWTVRIVRMTVKRYQKARWTESEARQKILDTVRTQRRTEALKKWKAQKKAAWELCKKASPTKVVSYNLGSCPMTEQEQALLNYYLVAWREPSEG